MGKFIIAILFGLALMQGWKHFSKSEAGETSTRSMRAEPGEVTLYATSWCGYCKAAREFFAANNIPFKEYDIEKSPEGKKLYTALGGKGAVPLIEIRDSVLRGFNEQAVRKALVSTTKS
jgi:mycoredoxin